MGDKVKFTCKNCGWETSIRKEWADLRPKRCMNRKCNTSFLASPDKLDIKFPAKVEKKAPKPKVAKKTARKKKSAKTNNSKKASS